MFKKLLSLTVVTVAVAAATPVSAADYLLSNFSNFASQDPSFSPSWRGGTPSVPQYTQNTNFISFVPVNGGNPGDDGSFDVAFADTVDLTGLNYISLTARVDAGNTAPVLKVKLLDENFGVAEATFSTSTFDSLFSNQRAELVYSFGFNPAAVIGWHFTGANFAKENDFRLSFDEVSVTDQLVPIPEPTLGALTWLLIAAGFVSARRRRPRVSGFSD